MTRKYKPLQEFLTACGQPRVSLSFAEIEGIIGAGLPNSAREHQAWWANNGQGHSHSKAWLGEGWKTQNLNIVSEKVEFYRVDPPATGGGKAPDPTSDPLYSSLIGTVTFHPPDTPTAPSDEIWEAREDWL